ncbi:MAG: nitroreductase family deazaflavin-dependent oxidoreductase [Pseudomonadales bacterium]|nr:nitroreductase family deazaflavin-dependent oxidoreductase [Pseudomonadales bacterium]
MKVVKIIVITVVVVYVGIVVAFESLLGYYQPEGQNTVVITTTDDDGEKHSRVVSGLETDGNLYVAANHWPRNWYYQALENPEVMVDRGEGNKPYIAVPVEGEEHERVDNDHSLGFVFRILTGFPPRYFVRLDPQ